MSNTSPLVTCIGTATLDAVLVADGPLHADSRIAAKGGLIAGGGPAATAAVAVARQGVSAAFIGQVGDDEAGATIKEGLEREGIETSLLQVVPGGRTALSAVIVDSRDAGRLIVTHPGALTPITPDGEALALCERSRWVHVDQAGWPAVAELRDCGMMTPISVDGGNPIEGLDVSITTIYAPSEGGLLAASGKADLISAMCWALDAGARLVVVTRGAAGAIAMGDFDLDAGDADATLRGSPVTPAPRMTVSEPAPSVPVISTLGAGDVFHGLLLAALCHGASVRDAMKSANVGAAMACAGLDGRSAIPDRATLEVAIARGSALRPRTATAREGHPHAGAEDVARAFGAITRPSGAFAMVAIDQRESLRAMLSPSNPADVPDAELVEFKHEVTLALSGYASAILFDRGYGLPAIEAIGTLSPSCGLILAADVFEQTAGGPIRSVSVDRQAGSVARAVRASAMKLLVPWRTDQSPAKRADLVDEFVDLCREFGMLSLVEAVVQDDGRRKPDWYGTDGILCAAEEMASHAFDLYKAQVPTFGAGTPDEITSISRRLTEAIGRPWVVLSSGVPPERFGAAMEAACRGGASGFLAGRAIWTSALAADDRAAHLVDVSVPRLKRLLSVVDTVARPWHSSLTGVVS